MKGVTVRKNVCQFVMVDGYPALNWSAPTRWAGQDEVLIQVEIIETMARVLGADLEERLLAACTDAESTPNWLWVDAEVVSDLFSSRDEKPRLWRDVGDRLMLVVQCCRAAAGLPLLDRHGRKAVVMPPTGTACPVCNEPQFDTPSGVSCSNGHGGA